MLWIGLTGGIASGKSTVTSILKRRGIPVVDADELAKQVVSPGGPVLKLIIDQFGPQVLTSDQVLDRKKMAEIVFGDSKKLLILESLIHPEVQKEVQRLKAEFENNGHKLAFYDVPLLFEKKLNNQFDKIAVVTCRPEQQRDRMRNRNHFSEQEINSRLAAQIPLMEKEKNADFIIRNEGSIQDLEKEVEKFISQL